MPSHANIYSARYVRNRTRFMNVPAELDVNSNNPLLVNAALTAGLYPKILSVDPQGGQMRTITNNQQAYFHPSSINFGRNVLDFSINYLTYFTLMLVLFSPLIKDLRSNSLLSIMICIGIHEGYIYGKQAPLTILLCYYSAANSISRYQLIAVSAYRYY
jgi:hypothetical protein